MKWNPWMGSLLLVVGTVAPALARSKDASNPTVTPEGAVNAAAQPGAGATPNVSVTAKKANGTALLGVVVMKGVLAPAEANAIRDAAPDAEFQMLVEALARKGVVSAEELSVVAEPIAKPVEPAQAAQAPATPGKPAAPKVIPAVAPLRVLQLEPSKPEGMVPDLKLGTGARLKVYGMVKTSLIYDTSSPYGADMPSPGFITASGTTFDPGPTRSPEFHAKARQTGVRLRRKFLPRPEPESFHHPVQHGFDPAGVWPHRSPLQRQHQHVRAVRAGLDTLWIFHSAELI